MGINNGKSEIVVLPSRLQVKAGYMRVLGKRAWPIGGWLLQCKMGYRGCTNCQDCDLDSISLRRGRLMAALLDRLTHNADIIELIGEAYSFHKRMKTGEEEVESDHNDI